MSSDLVLISLDTLRADVAYNGNFRNIERIRRLGTTFTRTVSAVPLTPPSHATIFTGTNPPVHGIRHLLREKLDPSVPTLAELLRARGYATGAIVSCPGMNRWYDLDRGFDHYDDEIPPLADGRNALEVVDVKLRGTALKRATTVTDRALAWMDAVEDRPIFLFAHYFDAHWPYEAPVKTDYATGNAYEEEVAFVDREVGRLCDGLEARLGSLDDVLIVLLSDHGEDLAGWYGNDHAGPCGHPEEEGHGCLLFDATQLVPLVVARPRDLPTDAQVSTQVRLSDVAPTILDLLGFDPQSIEAATFDGASLRPLLEGHPEPHRPAYMETFFPEELAASDSRFSSLRPLQGLRLDDRYKVIWETGGRLVRVYDLSSDPDERHPVRFTC